MGIALMMEGVLSACYHVCPNYSNFQFGKLSSLSPFELEVGFAMLCLLLSCWHFPSLCPCKPPWSLPVPGLSQEAVRLWMPGTNAFQPPLQTFGLW